MAVEVGAAYVSVRPSLVGFQRTVDRDLRRMAPAMVRIGEEWGKSLQAGINSALEPVKVKLDIADPAKLATLNRNLDKLDGRNVNVQIKVDVAGSMAELAMLNQIISRLDGRTIRININADAVAALAQLLLVNRELSRVDGQRAHASVDVDTAGAMASLFTLRAAMLALGTAGIPQIAAIGAGVIGLAGPLAGAAAGFGGLAAVALPAISHVKAALDQETQATQASGQATGQAAQQAQAAAAARQQLASAVRNAADAHRQALEQVRQAELGVADAQRSARQAQDDLTRAREEARRQLEDLHNQVASARLSLEESKLGVEDARLSWQQMGAAVQTAAAKVTSARDALSKAQSAQAALLANPAATDAAKRQAQASVDTAQAALKSAEEKKKAADLDARQAELNYRQAVQRLKEQQLQLRRLQTDERNASKAGVEGSDQVRSARQRLADANRKISESERALSAARANVARVDQQSADQIANARRALAQASQQAATSTAGLGQQLVKLTPLEQQLATAWQGLTGAFNEWARALQPAVLPLLIKGIGLLRDLLPTLTPIVLSAAKAVGGLLDQLSAGLKSPFFKTFAADLARWAGPAITLFGQITGNLIKGFAGIAQAFAPIGFAFLGLINRMTAAFARFTTGLVSNPGFQRFAAMMIQVLDNIAAGWSTLLPLITPILGTVLSVLFKVGLAMQTALRPVAAGLLPVLNVVAQALARVVMALLPVLGTVGQFIGALATGLAPVLTTVADGLADVAQQILGSLAVALRQSAPALQQLVTAVASLIPELLPLARLWAQWLITIIPLIPAVLHVAAVLAGILVPVLRVAVKILVGLWTTIGGLILPVMRVMVAVVTWVASVVEPVFKTIGRVAVWLWRNAFGPAFRGIVTLARWLYTIVAISVLAPLIVIFKVVAGVATWLWKTIFVPAWRGIVAAHKQAWATIKPVVNALGAGIRYVWKTFVQPAFDGMRIAVGKLAPHFKTAVDAIRRAWDGLKAAAKGPVAFVVNTVFNGGIVKLWNAVAKLVPGTKQLEPIRGFATGGVMPGYAPGKDRLLAAVSPGESIFRPEFTRAVGQDFVTGANSAARSSGVSGVLRFLGMAGDPGEPRGFAGHFALGGVVGGFLKAAKNYFAGGLVNTAKKAFNPLVDSAQRAVGGTAFGDLAVNTLRGLTSRILGYFGPLEQKIGGGSSGAVRAVRAMIGTPYSWGGGGPHGPSRGFGRGANTVGFDCSSLMQYGWYQAAHKVMPRTTYTQRPFLRPISKPVPGAVGQPHPGHTYMYSGAGKIIEAPFTGGFVREVPMRPTPFWGVPPWGKFAEGGIVQASPIQVSPMVYDQGGYLPPGMSTVYNGTGRPEPVLTNRQLAALASSDGSRTTQIGSLMNVEEQHIHDAVDVDMVANRLGFAARSSTFG